MLLCLLLVTLPTVSLGILNYNTYKNQVYANIEQDLTIISQDWQKITAAYIEQEERILKREEVLVEQRLKSIALDVKKLFELSAEENPDKNWREERTPLYGKLAEIRIGRSGYVGLIGMDGTILLAA